MPQKRKKWTEEEERALIDKYAEMQSDGTLGRMRNRLKKFQPIAAHVNAGHHAVDPVVYPFLWSWKDASTKVQNMRHQYLLVKQKLLSALRPDGAGADHSALDWSDGLSLWPNFLRYKHVFGDAPLKPPDLSPAAEGGHVAGAGFPVAIGADDDGDLGLGLGFDCCGGEEVDEEGFDYEEVAPPPPNPPPLPLPAPPPPQKKRKKRPERRAWARLAVELARLREREARMEEQEAERERKRLERERAAAELEERARREAEEGDRRRREEEREWEERMERRRAEWRERTEGMLSQHRVEMENIHARILHDQQSLIGQLLGIVSHWAGPSLGAGLSDGTGIGSGIGNHHQPYLAQMMQNLHHMNGMVPGENRVGGDGQEDQFIVDE